MHYRTKSEKVFENIEGDFYFSFPSVYLSDFSEWCKINNMVIEEIINSPEKVWGVPSYLDMDNEITIEDGIKGGSKTWDDFYYDKNNETCYVELVGKAFPPLSRSGFDIFQGFFPPYFSRFGRNIEVTGSTDERR